MHTSHQFLLLSSPPAKEARFRTAKKLYGSTFAFQWVLFTPGTGFSFAAPIQSTVYFPYMATSGLVKKNYSDLKDHKVVWC